MRWVSLLVGFLIGGTTGWVLCFYYQRRLPTTGPSAGYQLAADPLPRDVPVAARTAALPLPAGEPAAVRAGEPILADALPVKKALPATDDLEIVGGIGPKIADLLREAGIGTLADLAAAELSQLQAILQAAGPRFRMARPDTWPRQAELAAAGRWEELRALQAMLTAGVTKHT